MKKEYLERYSKICDDCAEKLGGICNKEIVCYNLVVCEVCDEEKGCLSVRDYKFNEVKND